VPCQRAINNQNYPPYHLPARTIETCIPSCSEGSSNGSANGICSAFCTAWKKDRHLPVPAAEIRRSFIADAQTEKHNATDARRNLRHQECSRHRRDAIGRRDHCGNSGQDPERGPQLSVGSDANRRRRKLFSVLEGGLKAWREQGLPVSRSLEDPKVIAARLGVKLPNS